MYQLFGTINWPSAYPSLEQGGLTQFIANVIYLIATAGGIMAFLNIIMAGFAYISSGGDSKATQAAWAKIYMSLIGLVIIVASFLVAGLIGIVFFGDAGALINPKVVGPGSQ